MDVMHLVLALTLGRLAQKKNYDFRHSLRIQLLYPGVKMCNYVFSLIKEISKY